jgi:hypothetical protein
MKGKRFVGKVESGFEHIELRCMGDIQEDMSSKKSV